MDIEKAVAAEHSKRQCLKIVAYVSNNPGRFKELVEVFLKGPYRITQRAAWPLSVCVEAYPELAIPHLPLLIKSPVRPGVHDSVKRNVMRLLQFIDIPKRWHGRVLELGFNFLNDHKEPVAIRVFSMTVIHNIIRQHQYPELDRELELILSDELPNGSAAFRSRGIKILRELKLKVRKNSASG
jgi:hypothetical protein